MIILEVILLTTYGVLTFWALYYFFFALLGKISSKKSYCKANFHHKVTVFIPAYKEDAVIITSAQSAYHNSYPNKEVVIIADSLEAATIRALEAIPVKVIEVNFENSTKAKALNKALDIHNTEAEVAVVLDSDNIMDDNFLFEINNAYAQGHRFIQGHRIAKNLNTAYAILDACSEEINNHIFRKGHCAMFLSSALIGSGMAFNYAAFKDMMSKAEAVGGFDKELELSMLKSGCKITYAEDALVYDEKVQSSSVFHHQRKRWLSAQTYYFKKSFVDACKELIVRGNIDYFNKSLQTIQIPRILLIGSSIVFLILSLIIPLIPDFRYWLSLWVITFFAMALAMPNYYTKRMFWISLLSLPKAGIQMFALLFKLKGANKKFIHTPHNQA